MEWILDWTGPNGRSDFRRNTQDRVKKLCVKGGWTGIYCVES